MLASLVVFLLLPKLSLAALELFPSGTTSIYPFAINIPTHNNSSTPLPVLLFLHGSGARGTQDELREKITYDGVGWLLSKFNSGNKTAGAQQIVAEDYLTILPLLPATDDAWDSQAVLSVLDAVTEMSTTNSKFSIEQSRVTLAGYSIGSYGAWYTVFNSSYPTRFSSIVAFGGSSNFTNTQLEAIVHPPQNVSTLSIYAAGGSLDEKQPGSAPLETISELDKLANPGLGRNWTAVELEGMNHKLMSQEAWFDMGWLEFVKEQHIGGRNDSEVVIAGNDNGPSQSAGDETSGSSRGRRIGWW
ncbi:hypothetical protein JCM3765_003458 [Sporobolomyces pararoseus]